MKISVVMTAYNAEKFIREAIDSVLSQSRKADEIIVVDDCSTDKTADLVKEYGDQVTYYKTPVNSGALSTTFYGVVRTTGDVLLFLDGDDLWLPGKIENVVPVFEQDPMIGIVSHDYVRVDSNRKPFNYVDETQLNIERILRDYKTPDQRSDAFKDSILGKKGFWGGSAYSLRKSFIEPDNFEKWRAGIDYIRYTYLDQVMPTYIILNHPEVKVGYVHKKLFEYRIHSSNFSGNKIPDVTAAKNALRMGFSTTKATHNLISSKKGFESYAQRQQLMIIEYQYLE
ncbi:MAG: glycosyltransferase family 2 protein, partial [Flavisolibacter sp.]